MSHLQKMAKRHLLPDLLHPDCVNWFHFPSRLVMESKTAHTVRSGAGGSSLGQASSCVSCWKVGESARMSVCVYVCVSCQIQLICQRRGLFHERPENAAQNHAAINLRPLHGGRQRMRPCGSGVGRVGGWLEEELRPWGRDAHGQGEG